MTSIEEIKNLPLRDKWLILEALANDSEVIDFLAGAERAPDITAVLDAAPSFREDRAIQYLKRVDEMLASGQASMLAPDEVLSALKLKRNALQG